MLNKNVLNPPGEVGIFPALMNPARQLAVTLLEGQVAYLADYPSFGVCRESDFSSQGEISTQFVLEGENFVLFETHLA